MRRNFGILPAVNLVIFLLFTAALVFARSFQFIVFTNFETGNFEGSSFVRYCFWVLIAVYFIILSVIVFKRPNLDVDRVGIFKAINMESLSFKISSILCAVAAVVHSFFCIMRFGDGSVVEDYVKVLIFFSGLLMAFSAVYFAIAFRFKDSSYEKWLSLIFVFPIVWVIVRLLFMCFSSYVLIFTGQEGKIYSLQLAFFSVFFICLAKVLSGFASKRTLKYLTIFGFMGLMVGIGNVIPKIIFSAINFFGTNKEFGTYYDCNINIFNFLNFMFIDIFVLFFIFLISVKSFSSLNCCDRV